MATSRCPVCLEDVEADAELECGHAFCASCAVEYVKSLVNEGKVSDQDLSCPETSCRHPFGDVLLRRLLISGPEGNLLYERLLDFQARRFIPEPGADEKLVACPTAGCSKALVPMDLVKACSEVCCPTCQRLFCAACSQASHVGTTCEAAELERMDPELRRLIAAQSWKRCPACRNLCERQSGCNFMTCPSEQCQSRVHFCYLCGVLLAAADHSAHFEGFEGALGKRGPFGSICANHREVDFSLPTQPPPPRLSVAAGNEEGGIVLRITWGAYSSQPPTIYYRLKLTVPGSEEVRHMSVQAYEPYHDLKRLPKYRRYQASVVPVNINGPGPSSEVSEVVYFHPRELQAADAAADAAAAPRSKRWTIR